MESSFKHKLRILKELIIPFKKEYWDKTDNNHISIMTLNLRGDNYNDGKNNWLYRREAIINMIKDNQPDIICCQEAWTNIVKYLKAKIGCNYKCYGTSTFNNKPLDKGIINIMGNIIFYNKNRFTLIEKNTFWLSDVANSHPTKAWSSKEPRNSIVVELRDKETGKYYTIFNTHFDHVSSKARNKSAELLIKESKNYYKKSLICFTGDFNDTISDTDLNSFKDLKYYPEPNTVITTFNGFRKNKKTICDYFVLGNNSDKFEYKFKQITKGYGVPYISDHYPMILEIYGKD
jgi:endonuclease/exonuclease/phosphatase family metal-dependent hydrolase